MKTTLSEPLDRTVFAHFFDANKTPRGRNLLTIMLVTRRLQGVPRGGRELLCKLNYDALRELYNDDLVVQELGAGQSKGMLTSLRALGGSIDGVNERSVRRVLDAIRQRSVQRIFVDGSNLGRLTQIVKRRVPAVELITFFHNVEARFFWGSFRQNRTAHALGVLIANYLAERMAVRYSDKLICLSDRDSRLLKKVYGRPATHIAPMALQDQIQLAKAQSTNLLCRNMLFS